MRVVFIGKNHEFSLAPLKALANTHHVVGIVESAPRKASCESRTAVTTLVPDWITRLGCRNSLRRIAIDWNVPYMYLTKEAHGNLTRLVSELKPDVLCVASLSQLLRPEVLNLPRYGAINLHPSLLPKYHGPFPWFWQYFEFEKEWGVTVHKMDEGQDTGPVVKKACFSIPIGMDIKDAMRVVAPIGARLMVEALNEIEAGVAVYRPQPAHSYPKARIVDRDEKLINWKEWPLERVWHVVRGTYPWLDAVDYPHGVKGLCRPGELERCECDEIPGRVYRDGKGYYIAHREGKIRLYLERPLWSQFKRMLKRLMGE